MWEEVKVGSVGETGIDGGHVVAVDVLVGSGGKMFADVFVC